MTAPAPTRRYEVDGQAIYARSFAIIRAEADLASFAPEEEPIVVRMIHALGLTDLAGAVRIGPGFAPAARAALAGGAPILCDSRMVAEGITRRRLPAENQIMCPLSDASTADLAHRMNTTRSAAAVELWRPHLHGAIAAIGNAPTALFHLLDLLNEPGAPRPAAIIGCPVGFVGAAESKAELMADHPAPALAVMGRLGGSAVTVAAINALITGDETRWDR